MIFLHVLLKTNHIAVTSVVFVGLNLEKSNHLSFCFGVQSLTSLRDFLFFISNCAGYPSKWIMMRQDANPLKMGQFCASTTVASLVVLLT